MDGKTLSQIIEEGIDRYRLHVSGAPAYIGDTDYWSPVDIKESSIEDHVIAALQCVADVGRERLAPGGTR